MKPSVEYFKLVLNEIYNTLKNTYEGEKTLDNIRKLKKFYPKLVSSFEDWITNYWNLERKPHSQNDIIININDEKQFCKAIIYYISGMTDNFAIDIYNEIIGFYHSHPDVPAILSDEDKEYMIPEMLYLILEVREGITLHRNVWKRSIVDDSINRVKINIKGE